MLTANGWVKKITSGDLTLRAGSSGLAIDVADSVNAAVGNVWILADNGDIQLGGSLVGKLGVSVISSSGSVFSPGASGAFNVAVVGNSNDNIDGSGRTGVDLRNGGKAAVVIISQDPLTLGTGAELTAGGLYSAGRVDDRSSIYFLDSGELAGEAIDVAVYLASNSGDVDVGSAGIYVAPGGTAVVDAYDNVAFGSGFVDSLAAGGVDWLEACSRVTTSLAQAAGTGSLPYANDQEAMADLIDGAYVLRGSSFVEAPVLHGEIETPSLPRRTPTQAEASSTVLPAVPQIVEAVEVGATVSDNIQWLGEELGLCEGDQQGEDENRCQEITQAYLAGAFLQATDLRPHQAATQLRELAGLLHDTDGSRIGALGRVINEFAQPEVPPSPEQFASIGQAFALHANDTTHYAVARQWLDALAEYVVILMGEIGWPADKSIEFVMGKYGPTVTGPGDVSVTAYIQMHLEDRTG